jgi:vitamin B12 transporter
MNGNTSFFLSPILHLFNPLAKNAGTKKLQMEKNPTIKKLALFAIALWFNQSFAQSDDTTKMLNEVTISAMRTEKNSIDVPRSVTIITSDELKKSIYNNVADLLSTQAGIFVAGTGQNFGNNQSVFTRGANSNHTVIMIDGVRISDPSTVNNAPDLSELSLFNVERIEITRGSHSSLYGSSAIGGVINIITKKNYKPGFHLDANLAAGNFGKGTMLLNENLFLNYTHKSGVYLNAEVFNLNTKGLDATRDTITNPNALKLYDNDNFSKLDLNGKLGYKNSKIDAYFSFRNTNQNTDIDKLFQGTSKYRNIYSSNPDTYYDGNYTLDFTRSTISYGASYKINDKFSVHFNGGISNMNRLAIDDSSQVDLTGAYDRTFFRGNYDGKQMNNIVYANLKLKGLTLLVGADMQSEAMNINTLYYYYKTWVMAYDSFKTSLDSIKPEASVTSGFIHADLNGKLFNEKLKAYSLALSARMNNHSLFGSNLTYEISPSYKLNEKALLYFSYATGFNAPSLYQLYSPEKDFTSGISRGNKNLKPETSQSFELGFKQNINDVQFSISVFRTVVENSIDYVYLWDKNQEIDSLSYLDARGDTYINIGKQTNRGIELGAASKVSEKLSIGGNISLIGGRLNYDTSAIDTTQTKRNRVQLYSNGIFLSGKAEIIGLTRRPATANIFISYMPCKNLLLRVDYRFVGSRTDVIYNGNSGPYGALGQNLLGDYSLLDVTAKYDIIKNLSALIKVENVFDTDYIEINGFNTRGRSFYLKLRYSF